MSKRLFWLLSLLTVLALLIAGCSGGAPEPAQEEAPAEEAPAAEEPAQEEAPAEEAAAEEEPAEEAMEEEAMEEEEAMVDTSGVTELTILWAQWDPADFLQEIANMYADETGITVNVVQEPWGSFGDLFFTEIGCEPSVMDQEAFILDVLGSADRLEIAGDRLTIFSGGRSLGFRGA